MFKTLILFTTIFFLTSCNKESTKDQRTDRTETETELTDNDADTTITDEEAFSSALIQNIMSEEEDTELQDYLEEQIYPMAAKSNKVTLDRISSSVYLLSYEENGTMKNFIIRKFYDPGEDEIVFEKSETETDAMKQFIK